MSVYNVEVQVKVEADDEDAAWRRVHDVMAYYLNGGTSDPAPSDVFDFELLDEAATREEDHQ